MVSYWNSYVFISLFLLLGLLLPIGALWVAGPFLRPKNPTPEKLTTYESGVEPFGEAHVRYNVRYYLFALMFVVFDVEIMFLYPWAVSFDSLGLFGLVEMLIFLGLLVLGLVYAWKKKVLEWK
ncbi:NADH dehydrogenase subunit A [Tumebacillus sp. BK434]|uniref:NADH-quinone oxidoreductase subunit A n=1 Tax=Tumebacillus avium TaxID=1903704 RepID=A0A1Y0IKE1_9BACL|nr:MULTISPECIES: NADH-quinone oxidoreductase subunit A [Tumebacillus]ARU60529.1 NADH:ubiquinone oxidoreductase subunit A [Tumebacillus avium]TCP57742.1 NADH dehydrogenase subunit A [Tumebacillus sp. BK434]